MNKCSFCTKSSPRGKCFWSSQVAREDDCKKAIKKMSEALGGQGSHDKKIGFRKEEFEECGFCSSSSRM